MQAITTLATIPAIVALVTLLKSFGVTGKWATLAAVTLGVGLAVADHYLGSTGAYQAASDGLLLGLAAAGIYDTAKASRQ